MKKKKTFDIVKARCSHHKCENKRNAFQTTIIIIKREEKKNRLKKGKDEE